MTPTNDARTQRFRAAYGNRRLVSRGLVPAAAVLAGSLGATTVPAGASAPQPVVTTAKIAGLGTVLVASHRPLYEMADDPKGHTSCSGACAKIWKPLIVSHRAAHHLGHVSGLGTIRRSNELQVAIHGHALYFFLADHSHTRAGGQGFANHWFTVKSNGALNRTIAKSPGTTATIPSASPQGSSPSSSTTTTRPTTLPPASPNSPAPTTPAPTSPAPTSPPTTSPPPPPSTTTTSPPPTTTTTTSGGGGGVGF